MADKQCSEPDDFWRPVPIETFSAYYSVSRTGDVRRDAPSTSTSIGRILSLRVRTSGHTTATLSRPGMMKMVMVHHLVALAFLGSPPGPIGLRLNHWQINHKNGNRADN